MIRREPDTFHPHRLAIRLGAELTASGRPSRNNWRTNARFTIATRLPSFFPSRPNSPAVLFAVPPQIEVERRRHSAWRVVPDGHRQQVRFRSLQSRWESEQQSGKEAGRVKRKTRAKPSSAIPPWRQDGAADSPSVGNWRINRPRNAPSARQEMTNRAEANASTGPPTA